ncbi:hypothetical protein HK100_001543, partial [Physocladia obscura]
IYKSEMRKRAKITTKHRSEEKQCSRSIAPFSPRSDTDGDDSADFESTLDDFDTKLVLHPELPDRPEARIMTPPYQPQIKRPFSQVSDQISDEETELIEAEEKDYTDLSVSRNFHAIESEYLFSSDFDAYLNLGKSKDSRSSSISKSGPSATVIKKTKRENTGCETDYETSLHIFVPPSPSKPNMIDNAICCGSRKLPCELWLLIFEKLPPKTVTCLSRACLFFALLASDKLYWRNACQTTGINCELVAYKAANSQISTAQGLMQKCKNSSDKPGSQKSHKIEAQDYSKPLDNANAIVPWHDIYRSQYSTRKTFLQSPYTYRRQKQSHSHGITCIVVAPDGQQVFTGSWDKTVKIWKIVPSALQQRAFSRIAAANSSSSGGGKIISEQDDKQGWQDIADGNWARGRRNSDASEELVTNEGSVWLEGNGNDGWRIGETVDGNDAYGESEDSDDGIEPNKSKPPPQISGARWKGTGKFELQLFCTIPVSCKLTPNLCLFLLVFEIVPFLLFFSDPVECISLYKEYLIAGGRGTGSIEIFSTKSRNRIVKLLATSDRHHQQPPLSLNAPQVTCIDVCNGLIATSQKNSICLWDYFLKPINSNDGGQHHMVASISKNDANICTVKIFQDPDAARNNEWWIIDACSLGVVSLWKYCRQNPSPAEGSQQRIQRQEKQLRVIHISPILDPQRDLMAVSEVSVIDCEIYTAETGGSLSFIGCFETVSGMNSAQISQIAPIENKRLSSASCNQWDLLCGFKDGNLRGWKVSTIPRLPATAVTGTLNQIEPNFIFTTETVSLHSLGDWITCLNENWDVVVAGAWDGRIRVWDKRRRGALRRSLVSDVKSAVLCLEVVGNQQVLVAGLYNGALVVYDFTK